MKKFFSKKMIAMWIIAFIVGLYSTLVGQTFWNWFAVPILHMRSISFLQAWALMILASAFVRGNFQTGVDNDQRKWANLATAIEMCIPDEKQQAWKDYWENEPMKALFEGIELISGTLAVNTLVLSVGFLLHLAIAR